MQSLNFKQQYYNILLYNYYITVQNKEHFNIIIQGRGGGERGGGRREGEVGEGEEYDNQYITSGYYVM